jgi:hypothetical protein
MKDDGRNGWQDYRMQKMRQGTGKEANLQETKLLFAGMFS